MLYDNSAERNIVWATTDYIGFGERYAPECEITADQITGKNSGLIRPRVTKARYMQNNRTRNKAEVFTPSWICNAQNDLIDEQWFGRPDVFNTPIDKKWKATSTAIRFPAEPGKTWQDYVNARRLEITCGEAPYLVSRYDTVTGEPISDVHKRIGLLDRKLRVIDENTDNEADWFDWVKKAYQSIYGFEYQGDNLLLARGNLLHTLKDYMAFRWSREPPISELRQIAHIISWNIWQMNGLTFTAPYSEAARKEGSEQITLHDIGDDTETVKEAVPCIIRDWVNNRCVEYRKLLKK